MPKRDLSPMSTLELKAASYDAVVRLKMAENDLQLLEQELNKRYMEEQTQPVVEAPVEEAVAEATEELPE